MNKVIIINDKSALDKFYQKLFFYKSFIFKKTNFTVETKYEEVKPIIKALNIKKKETKNRSYIWWSV